MILGIRNHSNGMRYAVIDKNNGKYSFININSENNLIFPECCELYCDKLSWLYQELVRIYTVYPKIIKIAIKVNEFNKMTRENSTSRETAGYDAATILFAKSNNLEIETRFYSQINTSSKTVQSDAEQLFGRTTPWKSNIADALMVAAKVI